MASAATSATAALISPEIPDSPGFFGDPAMLTAPTLPKLIDDS
jgi:hypothetical protein